MNLTSISQVRATLVELGVHPDKRQGQCFLIDRNTLDILLGFADLSEQDVVLEVGPGLGVVTEGLVKRAARVVAVEKDRRLFQFLKQRYNDSSRCDLRCADMLDVDANALMVSGVNKVVSNLPYSVGTRILVDIVRCAVLPELIVVTVQLEVGKRLSAVPDCGEYSMLSVWAQRVYDVELAREVAPTCFWPRPGVMSAMVVLRRHDRNKLTDNELSVFYDLTRSMFTHRRKQMATTLRDLQLFGGMPVGDIRRMLVALGVDEKARPENISVSGWCELARKCASGQMH